MDIRDEHGPVVPTLEMGGASVLKIVRWEGFVLTGLLEGPRSIYHVEEQLL